MMTLPFKGLARIHVPVPILHLSNLYARREKRNIDSNRGKPHLGPCVTLSEWVFAQ